MKYKAEHEYWERFTISEIQYRECDMAAWLRQNIKNGYRTIPQKWTFNRYRSIYIKMKEDIILFKLRWYETVSI